jgi:alpha-beta hydrolase superfamily lysophospholipase
MHVFYLHGFASSAQSSKAAFFRRKLSEHGIALHTPDFNEPDFSTLTITRMIDQVRHAIDEVTAGPVALIGSSLGGFVAVQVAERYARLVDRLVLLAPALDVDGKRLQELGDRSLDEWRRTNRLDVFHHAYGRVMPIHYELYEDACRHDTFNARVDLPIQIFQGRRDTAVDPETVERWARNRPNVALHLLDDDHQLHGSLETIWTATAPFLNLSSAPPFLPPDEARQA